MRAVRMSKIAEEKLDNLLDFLVQNWSNKTKNDFVKKLDRAISVIRTQPESFPSSIKKKDVRKCVVTSQTLLFYRFNDTEIFILTIFDARQDPLKFDNDL